MKHTPGPWIANFHHIRRMGGRSYAMVMGPRDIVPIAAVTLGVEGVPDDEGRANATLMAASPVMLAALYTAHARLIAAGVTTGPAIDQIDKAIILAEGRRDPWAEFQSPHTAEKNGTA